MEKDITSIDDLQGTFCCFFFVPLRALTILFAAQYESTLIKLTNAEVQIDDLKVQLDDALGAEEMLVQLTERNLELGEVCAYLALNFPSLNLSSRKSKKCASLSKTWRL